MSVGLSSSTHFVTAGIWLHRPPSVRVRGGSIDMSEDFRRCAKCDIPDFMALKMFRVGEKLVCDQCLTTTERKRILRERYRTMGFDAQDVTGKENL